MKNFIKNNELLYDFGRKNFRNIFNTGYFPSNHKKLIESSIFL